MHKINNVTPKTDNTIMIYNETTKEIYIYIYIYIYIQRERIN